MDSMSQFSRRGAMAAAAAWGLSAALIRSAHADDQPVFDDSKPTQNVVIPDAKVAEMNAAPLIPKTVHKLWNDSPTMKEPNAMQFTPRGTLLILDQVDPNKVFELDAASGKILRMVQTECIHGSGITLDGDGKWLLTSTKAKQGPPVTMLVDPESGKTLKTWVTPGWGYYGAVTADKGSPSGGHDVKWAGNGRYWMAVPASGRIFLMDEKSGKPVRSIPAPVLRTHGLAIDGNYLWSVASDYSQIQKISQKDGRIVGKIQMEKTDPAVHGLELKDGVLWYCDADKGWICNLT
jgi:sugar lactone lactonase YvrE